MLHVPFAPMDKLPGTQLTDAVGVFTISEYDTSCPFVWVKVYTVALDH